MSNLTHLYQEHIAHLQKSYESAIEEVNRKGLNIKAVLIHSGTQDHYFADDREIPFATYGHFAHWLPLEGAGHLLLIRPNQKPLLFKYVPKDFWYELPIDSTTHWQDQFEIVEVASLNEAKEQVIGAIDVSSVAYLGSSDSLATDLGIDKINPRLLTTRLDYARAIKTQYEVECLRRASALAAKGHIAAREAFFVGKTEAEIQATYLAAIGATEFDTPYGNIVALNEKAATLHYQKKRWSESLPGKLMLIDAGAKYLGYGSDITRTYLRDGVDDLFGEILARMELLQQSLVAKVAPGVSYIDINRATHRGVAEILHAAGLVKLSADEIFERGFTHPFFPHGVGHLLGIQVHDVSGHMADPDGTPAPPPKEYPFLRFTRNIEIGQVFTIEPGFYFIPMLLEPFRNAADSHLFDWEKIDRLTKLGGIRIEDNLHVTKDGAENLTRPYFN